MNVKSELPFKEERHHMTLDAVRRLRLKPKSSFYDSTEEMSFHCPYHTDKTPSMYINLKEGKYNCFSCGRGGLIEGLYKDLTGSNLRKDLGYQSDRFSSYAQPLSFYGWTVDTVKEQQKKIDQTYVHVDEYDLKDAFSEPDCKAYIHSRGISDKVAKDLGFMFTKETRINTTLFKDRLLIPIYEDRHLISMEGRRIYNTEDRKVLYPKNCSVNTLFDLDNLNRHETLYACEGLMDLCVMRSTPFFKNSTSIFGANLTKRQCSLFSQFDKVIYIPDLDAAGCKTMEAIKANCSDNMYYLMLPLQVKGTKIKDIGDLPKVGYTLQDLLDRKWLNYVKPIKNFNPEYFMQYIQDNH